jgi:hypothetical protein
MLRQLALVFIVGLVLGSLGSWKVTSSYKDTKYQNIILSNEKLAAEKFAEASDRAAEIERTHAALAQDLEIKNVEANKLLDEALAKNRSLARKLGGLRDPFAKPPSGCSVPTGTSTPSNSNDGTPTGRLSDEAEGLLSNEASEFLLELAAEADRAALYATTCHRWVMELHDARQN